MLEREWDEMRAAWVAEKAWPRPKWYSPISSVDRSKDFEAYFRHQLRARFTELAGDFRSTVEGLSPSRQGTAQTVFEYLQAVQPALEARRPDVLSISSTLDLVDRYMVWLRPGNVVIARATTAALRLEELKPQGWEKYVALLNEEHYRLMQDPERKAWDLRAPLDVAVAVSNKTELANLIGSGLQIRRLRAFRAWGLAILVVFFGATPLLVNAAQVADWPTHLLPERVRLLRAWVPAFSVLLVGLLGGFLSGLLQARSSRVTLADYQESMLKLALRPIVGGLVALIFFAFLSWKLFPAITTSSAGSFLLAAFFSGFSERYFLRLLDVPDTVAESTITDLPAKPRDAGPKEPVSATGEANGAPRDPSPKAPAA